jgi:hypothetical protein
LDKEVEAGNYLREILLEKGPMKPYSLAKLLLEEGVDEFRKLMGKEEISREGKPVSLRAVQRDIEAVFEVLNEFDGAAVVMTDDGFLVAGEEMA